MAGHIRAYLSEFFGTFALVFFSAGAFCVSLLNTGRLDWISIGLAYGLTVIGIGSAFGAISGGHFNPAITIALLIHRRITALKGVFYLAAQLFGSTLAAIALSAIVGRHSLAESPFFLGACDLSMVGFKAGTLLEAVATFFLVSTFYGTTCVSRHSTRAMPFATGLVYAASAIVLGPLTGAALNPARAFGPAVLTGHWTHAYVYWIGPIAGAVAASCFYEKFCVEAN